MSYVHTQELWPNLAASSARHGSLIHGAHSFETKERKCLHPRTPEILPVYRNLLVSWRWANSGASPSGDSQSLTFSRCMEKPTRSYFYVEAVPSIEHRTFSPWSGGIRSQSCDNCTLDARFFLIGRLAVHWLCAPSAQSESAVLCLNPAALLTCGGAHFKTLRGVRTYRRLPQALDFGGIKSTKETDNVLSSTVPKVVPSSCALHVAPYVFCCY